MNKLLKKILLTTITASVFSAITVAVNASPIMGAVSDLKQPDNSTVQVKLYGDEYYHYEESLDGYTLTKDPKTGWTCYARLNNDSSELVSTGVKYKGKTETKESREIKKEIKKNLRLSQKGIKSKIESSRLYKNNHKQKLQPSGSIQFAPSDGTVQNNVASNSIGINNSSLFQAAGTAQNQTVNAITILIDFPDEKSNFTTTDVSNLINQQGYNRFGNNGSVRDYFYDVSNGAITFNSQVYGYYHADKNKQAYNSSYEELDKLIRDAIASLDAKVDFSTHQ